MGPEKDGSETTEPCSGQLQIPHSAALQYKMGEGNALDKRDIIMKIVGDGVQPKLGSGKDSQCMEKYLESVDHTGLQDPEITSWESFIPCKAPLLDYLTVSVEEKEDNWRFL